MAFTFTINGHEYTSDPANVTAQEGYRFIGYGYITALANLAVDIAALAVAAVLAPGTSASSTTSLTVGTGSKSLTIETGKEIKPGMWVVIAQTSAPTNSMHGQVTAYDSATGALTVSVSSVSGSGTAATWTISLSAPGGATLGANTFTDDQTLSDNELVRAMLKDCGMTFVDKGTQTTGTQTFDYTVGHHQRMQIGGALTIAVSNWPPTGNTGELLLELVNAGSATITWPTINWVKNDGSVTTTFSSNGVTLQTSGTDFILLWTRNGGTTIYGKVLR